MSVKFLLIFISVILVRQIKLNENENAALAFYTLHFTLVTFDFISVNIYFKQNIFNGFSFS